MRKEIVFTDREPFQDHKLDAIENPVIDKTKEQVTVEQPKKKTNVVLWGVIIVVILLIIVGLCYYVNLAKQKKNGNI